jgi:hypothetical protein
MRTKEKTPHQFEDEDRRDIAAEVVSERITTFGLNFILCVVIVELELPLYASVLSCRN